MNEDSTSQYPAPGKEPSSASGSRIRRAIHICQASRKSIPPRKTSIGAGQNKVAQRAAKNALSKIVFPVEERRLKSWADREGLIINSDDFNDRWEKMGNLGGAEHDIYYHEGSGKWIKKNNLSYHASYLEYFRRLEYHNALFPEAPIEFIGFVWDPSSEWRKLCPVVAQKHVVVSDDRLVSREEVTGYLEALGYYPTSPNSDDYVNSETGIRLEDLHDENVLRGTNGDLYFIDPVIYAENGEEAEIPAGSPLTVIRDLEAALN